MHTPRSYCLGAVSPVQFTCTPVWFIFFLSLFLPSFCLPLFLENALLSFGYSFVDFVLLLLLLLCFGGS